ncbi:MAG: hypothetical protein LBT41_00045 [Candidatus Methanoplasma sp.]|nr:hypothetical protein [Candidatus Methanoplasma sp.]
MNPTLGDEFRIRESVGGFTKALSAAVILIISGLLFALLFTEVGEDADIFEFGLAPYLIRFLIACLAVCILRFCGSFYPPGGRPRLILKLAARAVALAALWTITSGGNVDLDVARAVGLASDYMADLSVNVRVGLLWFDVILSVIMLIGCLIPIGEYKDGRGAYLNEHPVYDERPTVYTRH